MAKPKVDGVCRWCGYEGKVHPVEKTHENEFNPHECEICYNTTAASAFRSSPAMTRFIVLVAHYLLKELRPITKKKRVRSGK